MIDICILKREILQNLSPLTDFSIKDLRFNRRPGDAGFGLINTITSS